MDARHDVRPGTSLSRYTLVEPIGEGGMGVVWKARDTRLGRHVAIKILRPESMALADRRRRFLQEARAAAAVTHPGIAVIHEIDETDGLAFIVMELVEGATLDALLSGGPLPLERALSIATQVAAALARAHRSGVVHRDLKPGNIMIGAEGQAKILDFGLACIADEAVSPPSASEMAEAVTRDGDGTGRLLGTVPYMSPEQALGESVDARSDVFSFGALLYEMLAGARPFTGDSVTRVLARILEADPVPLERLRPEVPSAVDRVVRRCLDRRREARYRDAGELLEALRETAGEIATSAAGAEAATIAVFPFEVRGSPEFDYLAAGMVDLLSTKLDGAGEIRSIDPHVILCCPLSEGGLRDPEEAAPVARRFGAGLFVLGSALAVGDRLRLEASLYEAAGRARLAARASVEGASASLFDLVDQLTTALLANRSGGPPSRLSRIAAMTTGSLAALKAYLEGEQEMRAMRRQPAADAYQRAVSADPGFALAWYRLAVAAIWSGRSTLASEASRQAVAQSGRLTERDRSLLEAFESSMRGCNRESVQRFRAIVGSHPDDVEAWYQLAEVLFHAAALEGGRAAHSRAAWERLLELDPRNPHALIHLCAVEALEGHAETLEELTGRLLRMSPDGDGARWARAHRAFRGDDAAAQEKAEASLRQASDFQAVYTVMTLGAWFGPPEAALRLTGVVTEGMRSLPVRALGHVQAAWLELAAGRWGPSRAHLDSASRLDPWRALESEALLSLAPWLELTAERREELVARLEKSPGPAPHQGAEGDTWLHPHHGMERLIGPYLIGRHLVALGRHPDALGAAEALEAAAAGEGTSSTAADMALSLRAHAAMARGALEEALALLERARNQVRFYTTFWSPLHSRAGDRWARAELLHRLERHEEARGWYASFAGTSLYDRIYLAPALDRLAGIERRLGRPERAAAHEERLERIWRGAEPSLWKGLRASGLV